MNTLEWATLLGVGVGFLTLTWLVYRAIIRDIGKHIALVKEETDKSIFNLEKSSNEKITLMRAEAKERKKEFKEEFTEFKVYVSDKYMKKELCKERKEAFEKEAKLNSANYDKISKDIAGIFGELKNLSITIAKKNNQG